MVKLGFDITLSALILRVQSAYVLVLGSHTSMHQLTEMAHRYNKILSFIDI